MRDEAALIAILRRLVDSAQSGEPEGEPWRSYHLACLIRDAGHEALFAEFVVQSMAAWEAYWQSRPTYSPEETARRAANAERLREIDRVAKQQFLSGHPAAAEETYMKGAELRRETEQYPNVRPPVGEWLIEAGRFEEAIELFRSASLEAEHRSFVTAGMAQRMHKAGAGARAVRFLEEFLASIESSTSAHDLVLCGQALAKMDCREKAILTFQQASISALSEAAGDPGLSLTEFFKGALYIARHQVGLGDMQGAERTVLATLQFAAPLEYEAPSAPAFDGPPGRYFKVVGVSMKPAAARWIQARGDLARLLAWVGREREAFDLLNEHRANQAEVLVNIARGQSDRGELDAAIRTLELIEARTLTTDIDDMTGNARAARLSGIATPWRTDGPLRFIEGEEKEDHWRRAAFLVLLNCVRFGDAESFARVNEWARSKAHEPWSAFSKRTSFRGHVAPDRAPGRRRRDPFCRGCVRWQVFLGGRLGERRQEHCWSGEMESLVAVIVGTLARLLHAGLSLSKSARRTPWTCISPRTCR